MSQLLLKKLRLEKGKLLQAAHDAATLLAEKLDDATLDENKPDRRRARNGRPYSKNDFMQWYGDDRGENEWECAPPVEEFNWAAEANGVVGAALWPRSVPHRVRQLPNGEIGLAAATTPNGRLVEELMATLLRARQAEFASAKGYRDPDAWNIGVVEPDVPIDIHTQLSEEQLESAWNRWRVQWQKRATLTHKQSSRR